MLRMSNVLSEKKGSADFEEDMKEEGEEMKDTLKKTEDISGQRFVGKIYKK